MLSDKEIEVLVGFFVRNGRVLDFRSASFSRFVRSVLFRDIPETASSGLPAKGGGKEARGVVVDVESRRLLENIVECKGVTEVERAQILASLLCHYDALIEEGGLAAEILRDDESFSLARSAIIREQHALLGYLPSAREVLPDLENVPDAALPPADYYLRLWRRSLELFTIWRSIDIDSLTHLDHLCHGFDAELLKLARAFGGLEVMEDALARKYEDGSAVRIAHIFMRASTARAAIDAFLLEQAFVRQDEAPKWLVDAIGRFNSELRSLFMRYVGDMSVPSYMQLSDTFAEAAECWIERGECLGMRRRLHTGDDWAFRYIVTRFIRYFDVFAHELNTRECSRRPVFMSGLKPVWRDLDGGTTPLEKRFATERDERERTAAAYCARAARLVRAQIAGVKTILGAAEYLVSAPKDSPLDEICRKARDYKFEYGWSDARFKSVCLKKA